MPGNRVTQPVKGGRGVQGFGIKGATLVGDNLVLSSTSGSVYDVGNVKGATGATGAKGAQGDTGATGATGATGVALALTGQVTTVGSTATVLNSTVINKVLEGFVSSSGPIAATDTILQAIQKLSGNTGIGIIDGGFPSDTYTNIEILDGGIP